MSWVIRHRPKNISEIQGQTAAMLELKRLVESHKKGSKAIMLYGPPGVGKTAAAYALANELGMEVLELNASDHRNKAAIEKKLGLVVNQASLFGKKRLILIDELDGISGSGDMGGVPALVKIIAKSSFPIVMTANEPYEKKFQPLRKVCVMVEFKPLPYTSIMSFLKSVCEKEGVEYDETALKSLSRTAGGDLRGAIQDLESASTDKKFGIKDFEMLDSRIRKESIIQALTKVLKSTDPDVFLGAYDSVDEDLDKIFLWLDENIPYEYKRPRDIARAYDALSLADVFFGRIRRWQYYRFYVYCYHLLSAGVALAKDEKYPGFIPYKPTTRILKIWQANMRNMQKKAIAAKIASKSHISNKKAISEAIPYFREIFRRDRKQSDSLASFYELDPPEIEWLRKG